MSMCPTRRQHVVGLLASREYNNRDNQLRINQRILHTLVCGDNYEFRKVWEKKSKSPIHFEGDKVFLDNYQTAYDGYGNHCVAPVNRFKIREKLPHKILDALLSFPSLTDSVSSSSPTERPGTKLYGITRFSLLLVDFKTGQVILKADLFNPHLLLHLKDISWMEPENSFVVSTSRTHCHAVRRHRPPDLVKVISLFSIRPLQFICMFEVTRNVFGPNVTDAIVREGLLIVMHHNEVVCFYSFNHLLEKHQITPQLIENSVELKVNMKITERPSCLFQTRGNGCDVQFGANPWHYLRSPVNGTFHVHSLETGLTVQNGILRTSSSHSVEMDRAMFHADDSNRIIHIVADEIRVLCIAKAQGTSMLTPHFTIPVRQHVNPTTMTEFPEVTSSGRIVKRRFSMEKLLGEYLTIHDVSYEDELELMTVTSTVVSSCRLKGAVGLYHNTTGHLLKTIALNEPEPFCMEHRASLDRDTLVQVIKYGCGRFLVQMYRLTEKGTPDSYSSADHKPLARNGPQQNGLFHPDSQSQTAARRRGRRQ